MVLGNPDMLEFSDLTGMETRDAESSAALTFCGFIQCTRGDGSAPMKKIRIVSRERFLAAII